MSLPPFKEMVQINAIIRAPFFIVASFAVFSLVLILKFVTAPPLTIANFFYYITRFASWAFDEKYVDAAFVWWVFICYLVFTTYYPSI